MGREDEGGREWRGGDGRTEESIGREEGGRWGCEGRAN